MRLGNLEWEETPKIDNLERSLITKGINSYPTIVPPETVLLGNSWMRRGDIVNLVSSAGGGKSVAAVQAMIAWALGLPYFGIKPPRPLRILLFSGEDDGVTLGQCREGFLEHSEAITGKKLEFQDLEKLDSMIRTEFIREHVGDGFHPHLADLLTASPVDLVIINPLLSYVGGEIVACGSEWLRCGLMPILQEHDCGALVIHHTTKLQKNSWENIDDTYSGIGGGEIANIPRSILTLKPTPAKGIFVLTVSKRQTAGWQDDMGKFTTSYYIRRSDNPERPAWIPVPCNEAQNEIAFGSSLKGGRSSRKVLPIDVQAAVLASGRISRVELIDQMMGSYFCSDKPAKTAILEAERDGLIFPYFEKNPHGGQT